VILLVDNSNFLKKADGKAFFEDIGKPMTCISMEENQGKINKGLGELSMLEYSSKYIDFNEFKRIFFFTGRHFVTHPYLIEMIVNSNYDIVVSKPLFYQLDGKAEGDGDPKSYNDMFFSMKPYQLLAYVEHFSKNKERMSKNFVGSEQLLYEYVNQRRVEFPKDSIIVLPALGIIRFTRKLTGKLRRLEIL
jgi:hypothetical protein